MAVELNTTNADAKSHSLTGLNHNQFLVWREFLYGAVAGAFGEGMMHPVDTIKTRIQTIAIFNGCKHRSSAVQLVRGVWTTDGLSGFYRGVAPGVMGSLATGATYFGVIESTKKWMDESYSNVSGHWAHFISEALGDTLGSVLYVPCEVMKQRMQVQGSKKYWTSVVAREGSRAKHGTHMYDYYSGMFQAGCSIWKEQGLKGLYAGHQVIVDKKQTAERLLMEKFNGVIVQLFSKQVTFYEAFKNVAQYGNHKSCPNSNFRIRSSFEGLLLGGLSAYLTTPLDVIKTRLQVQGTATRYNGWLDALCKVWYTEGIKGMFSGGVPRLMWYVPASALTFMAVEFLREHHKLTNISIDKKDSSLHEIS